MAPNRTPPRKTVVLGLFGSNLDMGKGVSRWGRWRPTVSLCQHEDLLIDRLELLHGKRDHNQALALKKDIESISPETEVRPRTFPLTDPWDFEEVYGALHDFAQTYPFDPDHARSPHKPRGSLGLNRRPPRHKRPPTPAGTSASALPDSPN